MPENNSDPAAVLAARVDEATGRILKTVFGLVVVIVISVIGSVFWAGSLQKTVENIDRNLEWLIKTKIPEMDRERATNTRIIDRGILPKTEKRIEAIERRQQELDKQIHRRQGP